MVGATVELLEEEEEEEEEFEIFKGVAAGIDVVATAVVVVVVVDVVVPAAAAVVVVVVDDDDDVVPAGEVAFIAAAVGALEAAESINEEYDEKGSDEEVDEGLDGVMRKSLGCTMHIFLLVTPKCFNFPSKNMPCS